MDPHPPPLNYLERIPSELVPTIFSFSDLPEVLMLRNTSSYFNNLTREPYFADVFNNRQNSPVWIFGHRLTQGHPHLGVIYGIRLVDGRRVEVPVTRRAEWGDIDIQTATLQDVSGSNVLLHLEPDHNLVVVNPFSGSSRLIPLDNFDPIVFGLQWYFTIRSSADDFLIEFMLIDEDDEDVYQSYDSRVQNWGHVFPPFISINDLRHARFDRTMYLISDTTGEVHTIYIRGNGENTQLFRVTFPIEDLVYSDSDSDEDELQYNYFFFGDWVLTFTTRQLSNDLCIVEAFWLSLRVGNVLFDFHRRVPYALLTRTPILLRSVSAQEIDDVIYIQFATDAVEALGTVAEINIFRYPVQTSEPWSRETFYPIAGNEHTRAFFTTRLTLPLPLNIN